MSFKAYLFAPHEMHSVCPCTVFRMCDLYGRAWPGLGHGQEKLEDHSDRCILALKCFEQRTVEACLHGSFASSLLR